VTLETGLGVVQGRWKWRHSVDYIRLSIGYTIVNVVLSCRFWVIWRWVNCNLEIWVSGHSRSFKLVPFKSLGAVSYSPSIVTMTLFCTMSKIKRDIGRQSSFLPCNAYALHGLCHRKARTMPSQDVCPSVCSSLSVRLSIMPVFCQNG